MAAGADDFLEVMSLARGIDPSGGALDAWRCAQCSGHYRHLQEAQSSMTDRLDELRAVMSAPEDVAPLDDSAFAPESTPEDDGRFPPDPPPPDGPPPGPDMPEPGEPSPVQVCAGFPLNDLGNARRFVTHFGSDLTFVPRVGWFVWTGQVWKADPDEIAVRRLAQEISDLIAAETRWITVPPSRIGLVNRKDAIEALITELRGLKDRTVDQEAALESAVAQKVEIDRLLSGVQDRIGQRLRHAKNAGNSGPIKNMQVESQTMVTRALEDLDADPLSMNTESGVLRFTVVGGGDSGFSRTARVELVPHARDHLMTKMIASVYDPAATCPRFDAFLQRIQPAAEMRRFLQRWYGLSATALPVQKLIFQYGDGNNGKSVLTGLIMRLLDSYAAPAKIESLTGKNRRGGADATPDLMAIIGARMVSAAEPDEGVQWQEGLIKELTGGETMLVRALHADFIEVNPYFKLVISGNHKPEIRGTDYGIWRRFLLVPFDVSIPDEELIPKAELDAMLWEERAGILNWLVAGLIDFLEAGLQEPKAVLAATQKFREESDPVGAFLNQVCLITGHPSDVVQARELGEAFNFWLGDQGRGQWTPGTVSKRLADKAERWKAANGLTFRHRKSSGVMRYDGIRFQDQFGRRFREAPRDSQGRILRGCMVEDNA
jgi:putative DNA primase/helicase